MIYYVNFDGIFCSVFDSQVFTLIKLLKEKGEELKLINFDRECFYKGNAQCANKKLYDIKNTLEDNFILLGKLKKGNYFEPLIMSFYINKLFKRLGHIADDNIVFHCRGHYASFIALKMREKLKSKSVKVLADLRGMVDEEHVNVYKDRNILYKLTLPLILNKIKKIEKYVINNADCITCVTESYRKILISKYKINISKIYVVPTCIKNSTVYFCPQERNSIRRKLNIDDKFVVVYSGGGQIWQQPEEIIKVFINIKRQKENAFLMILTKDQEIFKREISKNNIDVNGFILMSCEYKDIYKFLSCADLGLLIRENNFVNKIASPTKFAEYVSCHVPVLLTRGIGDLDNFIDKYRVGFFIDNIYSFNQSLQNINKNYADYSNLIKEYYSWDIQLEKYIKIYNLLR